MDFKFVFFEKLDSTNTRAHEMISSSEASEGTVVHASEQLSGRGQGNNSWHSQPGMNLTFSLVLEPDFLHPNQQFLLNKSIAIALLKTVREQIPSGTESCIKWPNDIHVSGKKIAGILIEHSIMGNMVRHSVIGIGINLNQTSFPEWIPNPVSLKHITSKEYDPRDMLQKTCKNLELEYNCIRSGGFQTIDREYESSLCGLGKMMDFENETCSFKGRIEGVDDAGRLCVLTADGELRKFSHGEIRYRESWRVPRTT